MPSSSRLSSQLLTRAMTFGRVLVVVLASLPMAEGSCLSDNQNNLHTCAQQCSEKDTKAACVSDCLIDLKVPSTCASCLGTQVDCGRRFCAKECSSGNSSSSCLTCLDTQCSDCSKALNFESHSLSDVGPDFTKLFLGATSEEADGPVSFLARQAGTCATGGSLLHGCGTPCYSHPDPSGCYARCSINACFSGCSSCGNNHCFESCRRSVASFECAVCISGHCGGCQVSYGSMMKQAPSDSQPILP